MKKLFISILLVLSCAGQAAAFGGILAGIMGAGTSGGGGGSGLNKSDDFSVRSNEDPLGHSQWTKTSWSAGTVWIYSGAVSGNGSAAPNAYYWSLDSFAANQCSAVTFKSLDGHAGAGVRLSTSGGYGAIVDSTGYEIKKYNSSATETVIQAYVSHTTATSNTYKFCASGTTLSLYENTTLLWSATDSSYSTGSPGLVITSIYGGQIATWNGTEL